MSINQDNTLTLSGLELELQALRMDLIRTRECLLEMSNYGYITTCDDYDDTLIYCDCELKKIAIDHIAKYTTLKENPIDRIEEAVRRIGHIQNREKLVEELTQLCDNIKDDPDYVEEQLNDLIDELLELDRNSKQ